MAFVRVLGDLVHLAAIVILLTKMLKQRTTAGISLKSMFLFAIVYSTRYLDLFFNYISLYNTVMKIFFIVTAWHICYLMKFRSPWRATYDRENDTFRILYLIVPCIILAVIFRGGRPRYGLVLETAWSFSIFLESVAILPQIILLNYTQSFEALTSHYLFCLGAYRVLYLIHWIIRYARFGRFSPLPVTAGIVQSLLYADFFYHYITQVIRKAKQHHDLSRKG